MTILLVIAWLALLLYGLRGELHEQRRLKKMAADFRRQNYV
jgi:hypothetical protein